MYALVVYCLQYGFMINAVAPIDLTAVSIIHLEYEWSS